MTRQNTNTLPFKRVPNVAGPVIVAPEKDTARNRECYGCNAAEDVVVGKCVQFTIGTDIKQTTRSIIRSRGEGITVREKSKR